MWGFFSFFFLEASVEKQNRRDKSKKEDLPSLSDFCIAFIFVRGSVPQVLWVGFGLYIIVNKQIVNYSKE